MIIRAIKFCAVTQKGNFGFEFPFSRNLTVVRAGNSSGKSTLFNTLLYGLGMEELLGGKGEKTLPYAVKDYIEFDESKILISESEVILELENNSGQIITIRRAIKNDVRSTKLVEVFSADCLTGNAKPDRAESYYLHDAGGAKKKEGFHRFLEEFLGFDLPKVPNTNAVESKLYLQAVFSAVAVEQKRGWTDYIATIPFYGIRDARTRVAEFILGLDVFETNAKRNRLNADSLSIDAEWRGLLSDFERESARYGMVLGGVPKAPKVSVDFDSVCVVRTADPSCKLTEYIEKLNEEYSSLAESAEEKEHGLGRDVVDKISKVREEIESLSELYERASSILSLHKASLSEYQGLLSEAQEDLDRNKAAQKLMRLGASLDVELSEGQCPTCHQPVEDNLLVDATSGPQMDLDQNISYLESQARMLKRQISGLDENVGEVESKALVLSRQIAEKHDILTALRGDLTAGSVEAKAGIRRQVQIEVEVKSLENVLTRSFELFENLKILSKRMADNLADRSGLPKDAYSKEDDRRISLFEKQFRANAGSFGYESAPIRDVEISRDNLVPCLSRIELREIKLSKTDIKSDSSASDFVRLIWSYLLALYQTANHPTVMGNHPGVLLFDEPGQHSMAAESQHALMQHLSGESELQTIVAASFDEMDSVYQEATFGVKHKLVEWEGKLIKPLGNND